MFIAVATLVNILLEPLFRSRLTLTNDLERHQNSLQEIQLKSA